MGLFSRGSKSKPEQVESSSAAPSPQELSASAAQAGTVVGKAASDILLTDEHTKQLVSLSSDILDGKSTVVLEWWGFH
jgi:hypothetical protein